MASKKIHVVPHGKEWAVKREGKDKASKVTSTKGEAEEKAREYYRSNPDDIVIHDRKGKIRKGKYNPWNTDDDDDCFITTACITYFNLPNDCYQLSTLRDFRDNYLLGTIDGGKLVSQYYLVAPKIVKLLNESPDRDKLYKSIVLKINTACSFIEKQKHEEAKKLYVKIVARLSKYFELA